MPKDCRWRWNFDGSKSNLRIYDFPAGFLSSCIFHGSAAPWLSTGPETTDTDGGSSAVFTVRYDGLNLWKGDRRIDQRVGRFLTGRNSFVLRNRTGGCDDLPFEPLPHPDWPGPWAVCNRWQSMPG